MSQLPLRLAVLQADLHWQDALANRAAFDARLAALAPGTIDLVILPEMFSTGFSMQPGELAEPPGGPTARWLLDWSRRLGAALAGSVMTRDGARCVNRLCFATPDGGLRHYDKRHLFRMADEHLRYGQGETRIITRCRGWRVLPQVCYDLRFPVWSRNRVPEAGGCEYDLALYVANWPSPRRYAWRTLLRARAIENLAFVVGVNRVGTDGNGFHYAGDSAALDPLGQPLVELGEQAQVVTVTLSAERLRAHRERFPAWRDADDFRLEHAAAQPLAP